MSSDRGIYDFLCANPRLTWIPARKLAWLKKPLMHFTRACSKPFVSLDNVNTLLESASAHYECDDSKTFFYAATDQWVRPSSSSSSDDADDAKRPVSFVILSINTYALLGGGGDSDNGYDGQIVHCRGHKCRKANEREFCEDCHGDIDDNGAFLKDLITFPHTSADIVAIIAENLVMEKDIIWRVSGNCKLHRVFDNIDDLLVQPKQEETKKKQQETVSDWLMSAPSKDNNHNKEKPNTTVDARVETCLGSDLSKENH